MERNEITAEISILELDHEEIFIRKEEGSPNSLSNMLNAAVTQLFIDMAMEAPGDNNDPKTFIQKITTLYSIALLTSLQNMAEQYSKAAQISDKKQFFRDTIDALHYFIEALKDNFEPNEPKAKEQDKAGRKAK